MGRRRKDLFGEIAGVHAEMQRMLEDMMRPPGKRPLVPGRGWQPATDVYRTPEHVVVRMEIAGVDKENIKVQFHQGHLIIQGFRIEDPGEEKVSIQQYEIGYGHFERIVNIPDDIDADSTEQVYEGGFLVVRLPFRDGGPKTIEIK